MKIISEENEQRPPPFWQANRRKAGTRLFAPILPAPMTTHIQYGPGFIEDLQISD